MGYDKVSRRGFLGWTAAAASAAATQAWAGTPAHGASRAVLRLGVIGCGARGTGLLYAIAARTQAGMGLHVTAVSDAFAPHLARAQAVCPSAVAEPDWRALITRRDVDAVLIAAPDHWHAPMAIAAMEAGKDVYCERPMGRTLDECRQFRDVARATGRIVQIGAGPVGEARWHTARRLVESGRLGALRWCQGSYPVPAARPAVPAAPAEITPSTLNWQAFAGATADRPFDAARFLHWRRYWDYSGGIATDVYYDKLAALLAAVGPDTPVRVSAAGGVYVHEDREVPDSFVMTAEYAAGHTIVLASSMATRHPVPAVIRGERATLYLEDDALRLAPEPGTNSAPETVALGAGKGLFDDWLRCLRTGETPVCDVELGYQAMVAVSMAVDAYRTGRTLAYDRARERVVPCLPRGAAAMA